MSNVTASSSRSSNVRGNSRFVGVPKKCWCGEQIVAKISKSEVNPYRRYYRCAFAATQKLSNDDHVFKWVEEALQNEIDALVLKNVRFEEQLKEIKIECLRYELATYEKIEKEVLEKVEDVLDENKVRMKKLMVLVVLGCISMVVLSKLIA